MRMGKRDIYLKENALTYYRRFFYDTAVNGNTAALECGRAFAGLNQMVFATDMPFCNQRFSIHYFTCCLAVITTSLGEIKARYSGS